MNMMNALMPGDDNWMRGKPMPGQGQPAPAPMATPQKKRPIMNALSGYFQIETPEAYQAGVSARSNRDMRNALSQEDYAGASQAAMRGGNYEAGLKLKEYSQGQDDEARKREAQGVAQLFSNMQPLQVNEYAMSDPAGFEAATGMAPEEYLQTAQRLQQAGMTPEQVHGYVLQKAQAELGQMPAGPDYKVVGDALIQTGPGGVRPVYEAPQKAEKPSYKQVETADGIYEYVEGQPESMRFIGKAPPKSPLVNVNTGEGPQETAFMKKAGELEAANFGSLVEMGQTSRRNRVILDQLDTEAAAIPGGLEAVAKNALGNLGIPTEGLSEIQATEALINQLVPAQRQPGSGPMSDRDLALFKASLPRLIQTTEGKTRILSNMKAINDYVINEGEIASRVISGKITPEQGRAEMQALGNPLAGDPRAGAPTGPQGEDLKGLLAPDGDPVTEEDVAETMRKYNVTREQVIAHLRGQ
jgi:hypothetical protein